MFGSPYVVLSPLLTTFSPNIFLVFLYLQCFYCLLIRFLEKFLSYSIYYVTLSFGMRGLFMSRVGVSLTQGRRSRG